MADQMTDYFHAHKDATTHDILSRKHAFHVRACEQTVVFVMHATGVFCVHFPPNCRYCVPAIRNRMFKKCHSLPLTHLLARMNWFVELFCFRHVLLL